MAGTNWLGAIGAGASGAGSAGFFSGVHNMIMGGKARRKAKKFQKAQARAQINEASRAKAAYEDEAAYQEQMLNQSLAGRGLSNSSIAREDEGRFARARQRAVESLDERLNLATQGYDVLKAQQRLQASSQYIQLIDQLVGIAGGAVSAGAGGA